MIFAKSKSEHHTVTHDWFIVYKQIKIINQKYKVYILRKTDEM